MPADKRRYKLLITASYTFEDDDREFLQSDEVARGKPITVNLNIKNLSGEWFPGGRVREIYIEQGYSGAGASLVSYSPFKGAIIPKLANNAAYSEFRWRTFPSAEGLAWINIVIEADDGGIVEYFASETHSRGTDKWTKAFYVANREMIELLKITKQLVEKS